MLIGSSLLIQVIKSEVSNRSTFSLIARTRFLKQVERIYGSASVDTMCMILTGLLSLPITALLVVPNSAISEEREDAEAPDLEPSFRRMDALVFGDDMISWSGR